MRWLAAITTLVLVTALVWAAGEEAPAGFEPGSKARLAQGVRCFKGLSPSSLAAAGDEVVIKEIRGNDAYIEVPGKTDKFFLRTDVKYLEPLEKPEESASSKAKKKSTTASSSDSKIEGAVIFRPPTYWNDGYQHTRYARLEVWHAQTTGSVKSSGLSETKSERKMIYSRSSLSHTSKFDVGVSPGEYEIVLTETSSNRGNLTKRVKVTVDAGETETVDISF